MIIYFAVKNNPQNSERRTRLGPVGFDPYVAEKVAPIKHSSRSSSSKGCRTTHESQTKKKKGTPPPHSNTRTPRQCMPCHALPPLCRIPASPLLLRRAIPAICPIGVSVSVSSSIPTHPTNRFTVFFVRVGRSRALCVWADGRWAVAVADILSNSSAGKLMLT